MRSQRKSNKLSQSAAGNLVGLKQATLSDFENKPDGTKLETLFRILAATNIKMHLTPRDVPINTEPSQWTEE